ncbi:MAG: hypothetical protein HON53_01085 [Planctomycetaceae bacterium]|jgi:hypothetical protein|nr:hypothetical protein [Planctomycetaceae bacterium]MBT6495219.1 hypothetical protein [Planctomycetaceae bacterium]
MRGIVCAFLLGGLCVLQSGCALTESADAMTRFTKRTFTFRPGDYRDMTNEETDDWSNNVGKEGRANQRFEKDPDSWWGKYIISAKARSIDRNLGIEYE